MTAYQMMLSESQERMLMVLDPAREAEARAVFDKWDLDFAVVGETIAEDRFLIVHGGEVKADLPLSTLASSAPEYDRPWTPTPPAEPLGPLPEIDPVVALEILVGSANHCARDWVTEQYDTQVMGDTVVTPGLDAGVVRVHGTDRGLAFTADVTPRYVRADPVQGGRQAVAEAFRNLVAKGARPLAATDNLNFGNPEKPAIMGQLVGAIQGIGEACEALDMPIVSGNVSLYNETDGTGIDPTPTIGAVGLLDSIGKRIQGPVADGMLALLLGGEGTHLGRSALLAEAWGREEGPPPPVDLAQERRHGEFVLENAAWITACTDLSDGGLALAAFTLAEAHGLGVTLDVETIPALFGEDQGRYLVACRFDAAEALMVAAGQAGVPLAMVGQFGGDVVKLGAEEAPLADLSRLYRGTFADLFA
jgi:phosphoribosylformylglycinamidine synthase